MNRVSGNIEEIPNYYLSALVGSIWAVAYFVSTPFVMQWGVSFNVALLISITIVTFALVFVHAILTGGTWFNKIPLMFTAVAAIYGIGGTGEFSWLLPVYVFIPMCVGITLGLSWAPLTNLFHKEKVEA